jgi:hypothetical protein
LLLWTQFISGERWAISNLTAAVLVSGMSLLTLIMAAVVHNIGSLLVLIVSANLAIFPERIKAK